MRASLKPILFNSVPGWVRNRYGVLVPSLALNFVTRQGWSPSFGQFDPATKMTAARAGQVTSLLPSDAAGAPYLTFANNVPAILPGRGLNLFATAKNNLLNSTAPATQTTASLAAGTYTLWVNGAGSATSSAGSATGSGFGAATNGSPNTFTLTGAGTVTVTVAGALNAFQLQSGSFGTPLIVTAGATVTCPDDNVTMALGSWFNASQGTFVAKWSAVVPNSANAPIVGFIKDATNAIYPFTAGTAVNYFSIAGSSIQYNTASGVTLVNGATNKVSVGYGASPDFGSINNGNTRSLSQSGVPSGLTTLIFGSASPFGGDVPLNGVVQEFGYFPTRYSNGQVQGLGA